MRTTARSPAERSGHASRSPAPFFSPQRGRDAPPQPFFQPRLTVGAPGDRFEQEADRVADEIVAGGAAPSVQRTCTECAEERAELRRQPIRVSPVSEPVVQRDDDDEDPLTEGLALTAEKALEEEAVKEGLENLWDDLPGEAQAALISFGGLNLGMAYISLIYSSSMRENLSDVDIGAPLSLIPYVPIESFKYKLPGPGGTGTEFSAELNFDDYFELLREHVPSIPITDLTVGLEGTLRPGSGFSVTGGSFGLEFLGGALTAQGSAFSELSPYPMMIPGRGLEPPSMLMQSFPSLPSMQTGFGMQGGLLLDLAKVFPGVLGGGGAPAF